MQRQVAVVDDDRSARAALTNLVNALGYSTRAFADPGHFLASDAPRTACCLIADLRLPGISGLALYQRLRAERIALPTVLVTAYPDEATRLAALKAGVRAYLAKPVEPDQLLACLRDALP